MSMVYEGSVKNLILGEDPTQLWFAYSDDYSVFDWGKMPDVIPGKGLALARLGEFFFGALADPEQWRRLGLLNLDEVQPWVPLRHHFIRREANRLLVTRVAIPKIKPAVVGGTLVYDYGYTPQPWMLIPLEVIFRFGVPAGSSLLQRKDWYTFDIFEGAEFERPLIEFSTKLESKDRVLSYQEACLMLGGDAQRLAELHGRTVAVSLFLKALFKSHGLKLWDGKLEWALMDSELVLVDSIGPDELRVSLGSAVFSKQFLRDFYLGSDWLKGIQRAEAEAKGRGSNEWKSIVESEFDLRPGPLSPAYLDAAIALYEDFAAIVVDDKPSTRFAIAVAGL